MYHTAHQLIKPNLTKNKCAGKAPSNSEIPLTIEILKRILKILLFCQTPCLLQIPHQEKSKTTKSNVQASTTKATALLLLTAVTTRSEKKYTLADAKCLPLSLKDQLLEKRLLIFSYITYIMGFLSFLE